MATIKLEGRRGGEEAGRNAILLGIMESQPAGPILGGREGARRVALRHLIPAKTPAAILGSTQLQLQQRSGFNGNGSSGLRSRPAGH